MSPYLYTAGMLLGVVGMAFTADYVRLLRSDVPKFNFFGELLWVLSLVLALTCFFMLLAPLVLSS
jgi:hypothetical protein